MASSAKCAEGFLIISFSPPPCSQCCCPLCCGGSGGGGRPGAQCRRFEHRNAGRDDPCTLRLLELLLLLRSARQGAQAPRNTRKRRDDHDAASDVLSTSWSGTAAATAGDALARVVVATPFPPMSRSLLLVVVAIVAGHEADALWRWDCPYLRSLLARRLHTRRRELVELHLLEVTACGVLCGRVLEQTASRSLQPDATALMVRRLLGGWVSWRQS